MSDARLPSLPLLLPPGPRPAPAPALLRTVQALLLVLVTTGLPTTVPVGCSDDPSGEQEPGEGAPDGGGLPDASVEDGGGGVADDLATDQSPPPPDGRQARDDGGQPAGCGGAVSLQADPGVTMMLEDDTSRGGLAVASPRCGGQPFVMAAPQMIYHLHLPSAGRVELNLAAGWSGLRAVLLDDGCSDLALACLDGPGRHILPDLAPGDFFLVLGGAAPGEQGPYELSLLQHVPGHELPGSCAEPVRLQAVAGTAQLSGTLRGALDNGRGSCTEAGRPDSVHLFMVEQQGLYRFHLQTEGGWAGRMYLRGRCANPDSELACALPGAEELLAVLDPGQVSLFVEADGARVGEYRLEVSLLPDGDGESCAGRRLLVVDPVGKVTVEGDLTTAAADLADGSCGSEGTPDLIYRILLQQRAALRIGLDAEGLATFSLRRRCDQPGRAEHCSSSGPVALVTDLLDPGDYSLVLRSYAGDFAGAFTLTVELIPAGRVPSNDGCASPWPIEVSRGLDAAFGEGTSIGAADDMQGSCGGAGGADVVFLLHLEQDSHLTLGLEAAFDGVLYLRQACAEAASELGCISVGAYQELRHVAAGDYYLIVDGQGRGAWGDFSFQIGVIEAFPLPTNDDCASAQPLVELAERGHAVIEADLRDATDSGGGSCGGHGAPDLVYHLDLPEETLLAVEDDSDSFPFLYLRANACDGPEVSCGLPRLNAMRVPAGTYFLFVDGSWAYGMVHTTVQARPIPPLPPNDRCPQAEELALDRQAETSFAGDTSLATNLSSASCGGSSAPELFYHFRLEQPGHVRILVDTRSSGFDGVVYLLGSCAAGAPTLACQDDPEQLDIPRLEAGDYWLVVDGFGREAGRFTGTISVEPLGPPGSGESCETAELSLLDPGEGLQLVAGDLADGTGALPDQACIDAAAQDRFHRLRLLQGGRFSLLLDSGGVVRGTMRLVCQDPATGFCLLPGVPMVRELPAGEYFFIARTRARGGPLAATPYRLTLAQLPPELAPPGASCARAISLDSGLARQRLVGTTVGAPHRRCSVCGGDAAGEVVYALQLPSPARLRATLTAHDFEGVLYLAGGGDCAGGPLLGCDRRQLELQLEAGEYHLYVDGATPGSTGDFNLLLELGRLAAIGDPCDPEGGGCITGAFCVTAGEDGQPRCLAPDPARQTLWAAELDNGTLMHLHPATGELLEQLPTPDGLRGPGCGLAMGPDGLLLLVDGGNPQLGIQIIDPWSGARVGSLPDPSGGGATGLARSAGELLLLDARARQLRLLAPDSGVEILRLPLPAAEEYGGLEVNGQLALLTMRVNRRWLLQELALPGGAAARSQPLEGGPFSGAALAGSLLYLSQQQGGTLLLLDPVTLRAVGTIAGPAMSICGLAGR